MLDRYMNQFSQELEMQDSITSPEVGHYLLQFDNEVNLEVFQTSEGNYVFKGVIGACPTQRPGEFLAKIMQANLFGRGTREASIGLNEQENVLTLSLEVGYNLPYHEWKNRIEDAISVINYWRKEAENYQQMS